MPIQFHFKRAFACAVVLCWLGFSTIPVASVGAEEPPVTFDVPALLGVQVLEFAPGHELESSSQKTIEIALHVTSEIGLGDRDNIEEFRFDIFWNRNVYPLADYAPKTRTVSEIEGLISIEKSVNNSAGLGLSLGSAIPEIVTGSAKADLSKRTGTTTRYSEVPQHEILVASGSVQRGTGAFFRFHPSKRDTLEGGRELIVAYRVPQSWRAGVIKVECRAQGHRTIVGSWREPVEESRAFVVPIFLEGDDQARQAAEEFVRSEQGLRQNWQQHKSRSAPINAGIFSFAPRPTTSSSLPKEWVHQLIQSGSDQYLERYRNRIPKNIASAAENFVVARQQLFAFSR